MIFERGNAAKQWILEELDRRFGQVPVRVLDLACGDGTKWRTFLGSHPNASVVGIDTDADAIANGQRVMSDWSNINLRIADAQKPVEGTFDASEATFDVVVAMSAIEHVVNREAFLATVWSALKPGGIAYLNYDAGHFRSRDVKERIMAPVSQLLALVGYEKPYMKKVDDATFRSQAETQGFSVVASRKHNMHPLKGFMRAASDEALADWFAFEDALNARFTSEQLDRVMWSTTLVLRKP